MQPPSRMVKSPECRCHSTQSWVSFLIHIFHVSLALFFPVPTGHTLLICSHKHSFIDKFTHSFTEPNLRSGSTIRSWCVRTHEITWILTLRSSLSTSVPREHLSGTSRRSTGILPLTHYLLLSHRPRMRKVARIWGITIKESLLFF